MNTLAQSQNKRAIIQVTEATKNMKPEIADDIELLVKFANQHFTEDKDVDIAANRVEAWLATYKPNNA